MLPRPRCWVTGAIEKCKRLKTYKSSTTSIGVNGDNYSLQFYYILQIIDNTNMCANSTGTIKIAWLQE